MNKNNEILEDKIWDPMNGNVPIETMEDFKKYTDPFFCKPIVIANEMRTRENYLSTVTYLQNVLISCYEKEVCTDNDPHFKFRNYPVRFKFYEHDSVVHELTYKLFVSNIILWIPFARFGDFADLMDDKVILDNPEKDVPGGSFDAWRNKNIIDRIREKGLTTSYLNEDFSEENHYYQKNAIGLSVIMGTSLDMHDIFVYYDDEDIHPIMVGIEDVSRPTNETEQEIRHREKLLTEFIIKKYPNDPLARMLKVGGLIKTKQLMELLGSVGYMANSSGTTIPIAVRNSYINGGLTTPSAQYIGTTGAYKALLNNKFAMGNVGYFVKSIVMLCEALRLDKDVYDCKTRYLIPYHIKNKAMLAKCVNKFYVFGPEDTNYKYVKPDDYDLIGKVIWTRNVITCAAGENRCCHICMGRNAGTMRVLDSIGAFLGEETGKDMEQNILSTKHLLITNSIGMNISQDREYFKIVESEIYLNLDAFSDDDDFEYYALSFKMDEIEKMEEMDDDSLYNTYINTGKIDIVNTRTGEVTTVQFNLDDKKKTIPPIYIDEDIFKMAKDRKSKNMVYFKDIDSESRVFVYDVINNEVAKRIYDFRAFIWTKKAQSGNYSIYDLGQIILEYFIDARVSANIVAGEVLLNRLIRSERDPFHRPDFTAEELEPFTLSTIQNCLKNNGSMTTGIAFENIRRQILADNYADRTEESSNDYYFRKYVPTPMKYINFGKYMKNKDN